MSAINRSLQALRTFPRTLRSFIVDISQDAFDFRPAAWDGLREANPTLESIDTYELVERRNYDQTGVDDAFKAFTDARADTMRLLDGSKPADLERRGQFEGYGAVTLAELVHNLSSHDQQHLSDIQWLLGKYAAPNPP